MAAGPLMDRATAGEAADPLPQAFVLTAIVISMAATAVMLALTALGRDDDTRNPEDPERTARRNRVLNTTGHGLNRPVPATGWQSRLQIKNSVKKPARV